MIRFRSKFHKAIFFLFSVITIGVIGYMLLSGFNFIDAVYMTVITISTVGFRELHPMSDDEKIFTIFLILTSIVFMDMPFLLLQKHLRMGTFLNN